MENPTMKIIPLANVDIITTSPRIKFTGLHTFNDPNDNTVSTHDSTTDVYSTPNLTLPGVIESLGLARTNENYTAGFVYGSTSLTDSGVPVTLSNVLLACLDPETKVFSYDTALKLDNEWFFCDGTFYNVKQ